MTTKMEKPTVEAVRFQSTDVIATSGERGVMLGGFKDGTSGNWFVSGTKGATEGAGTNESDTVLGYFRTASGVDLGGLGNWKFSIDESTGREFNKLILRDESISPSYNGWYTWFSTGSSSGYFQWRSSN